MELVEAVGGAAEAFGVAAEAEVGVDAFDDEVGQVFEVEGGEVFGFVLMAHGSEGELQFGELGEAPRLGEEVFARDLPGEGRLLTLQEGDDGADGGEVFFAEGEDAGGIARHVPTLHLRPRHIEQLPQTMRRKQLKNHLNAEVHLPGWNALLVQESQQVSRGRIGRIELGEGRRYEEEVGHGREGTMQPASAQQLEINEISVPYPTL